MSTPVEPFVVVTSGQVIAVAMVLSGGAAGLVAAVMKWSFTRNVKSIDDSIAGVRNELKLMAEKQQVITDRQHAMELMSMSKSEFPITETVTYRDGLYCDIITMYYDGNPLPAQNEAFVPLHWHRDIEINYTWEGNLTMQLDGKNIQSNKEEFTIVNSSLFD